MAINARFESKTLQTIVVTAVALRLGSGSPRKSIQPIPPVGIILKKIQKKSKIRVTFLT
jgi:hypothetical protein